MTNKEKLLQLCKENKLTLGSVESLTGGLFGATIASIPGASEVYMGGLITYDVKEKITLVNVDPADIAQHGVVSPEVAAAMAKGGRKALDVDICLSCTGNAGPAIQKGGQVGDVYIGLATSKTNKTIYFKASGTRNEIRNQVVQEMINLALKNLPMRK